MTTKIQLRRDTTTNWTTANPVLSAGEVGVNLTTGQIKIGNGTSTWNQLSYYAGGDVENGDGVGWRFEESTGLRFPDNTLQNTAFTGVAPIARKVRAPNEATIEVTSTGNPDKVWEFNANGSMTFPDGTEQTTAYTGTVYTTVSTSLSGIPEGFSVDTANPSNLTPGSYPNILVGFDSKNLTLDISIDEFYNISIGTIRDVSPATFVVGDSAVLNGNIFGGNTPADNVTITVSNLLPTAIDLTKSINKLIDGDYTLADGVEGQIMYLVPQDGTALNNVSVSVANARVGGNTTGAELLPFRIYEHSGDGFYEGTGLCTLIFTDGAWQQSGGAWD